MSSGCKKSSPLLDESLRDIFRRSFQKEKKINQATLLGKLTQRLFSLKIDRERNTDQEEKTEEKLTKRPFSFLFTFF
jgi:hypothetical protein